MTEPLPYRDRPLNDSVRDALVSAGLHPTLASCLARRGVQGPEELDASLIHLPPPRSMRNASEAGAAIGQAILHERRFLVVGDYDADGATATALVVRGLGRLGADIRFLVPDRFRFGYGLTRPLLEFATQQSANHLPHWIITVDNGISSVEGVAFARAMGIEVLVTDHHLPGRVLPDTLILNPQMSDCAFPSKNLAGVGVAFYLVMATRAWLIQQDGVETAAGRPSRFPNGPPRLDDLLPLVALGTVADLVGLDAHNRRLVEQGLRRIRKGLAPEGMKALFRVSGRTLESACSSDLGFQIGPRLNAAGRLADMAIGIRCLLSDDPQEAQNLAESLNALNQERREREASARDEAQELAAELQADATRYGLILFKDTWHQGIVGLLASRVKERAYRPVIAFAPESPQSPLLKGSGRSIPGVHLRDVLERVDTQSPGLIRAFGGHAMAAGLTIERSQLSQFSDRFEEALRAFCSEDVFRSELMTDGLLEPSQHQVQLAQQLAGQVWGQGFPPPVFRAVFRIRSQRLLKEKHLKLRVSPRSSPAHEFDAIWFNGPSSLPSHAHLAYELSTNDWQGQEAVQLLIRGLLNPEGA